MTSKAIWDGCVRNHQSHVTGRKWSGLRRRMGEAPIPPPWWEMSRSCHAMEGSRLRCARIRDAQWQWYRMTWWPVKVWLWIPQKGQSSQWPEAWQFGDGHLWNRVPGESNGGGSSGVVFNWRHFSTISGHFFDNNLYIYMTKLRFRQSFWGAERVWISIGSKVMTQNANISVSRFLWFCKKYLICVMFFAFLHVFSFVSKLLN